MEVKQHKFDLETRRDGLNLRTSNSYCNYMPNMNKCLNLNKLIKYLITFGRPSPPVQVKHYKCHYQYFWISYHRDKAIGKLRNIPGLLTWLCFYLLRGDRRCVMFLYCLDFFLVYWIFFSTSYATFWPKKLITGKLLKGETWECSP